MYRKPRQYPNRAALSLMELVVVLMIIGIAGAVAAPKYSAAISRHRLSRAADRVVSDLRLAKSYALHRSTPVYVDFTVATNTVGIRNIDDFEKSGKSSSIRLDRDPYFASISQLSLSGQTAVQFDGYGDAVTVGSITLRCGSYTKAISVTRDKIE